MTAVPDFPLKLYTVELPTLGQLGASLRARMHNERMGMRAVAEEVGVSTATVCRAAQAKEITATHYQALVRWLAKRGKVQPMSETPQMERLVARFEKMKAEGLRDFKFTLDPTKQLGNAEELASELNACLDAIEAGDYINLEPIGDSRRYKAESPFKIHIDNEPVQIEYTKLPGWKLMDMARKPPDYGLFLEQQGGAPDRQVSLNDFVELTPGQHFYTVPPCLWGADPQAAH